MCGIIGIISERNVVPLLYEGLCRLEYRGYDSAGMAIIDAAGALARMRTVGKVAGLDDQIKDARGHGGIAHTRWATHGVPSERNAHPHMYAHRVALVHNGIIENHTALRAECLEQGLVLSSDTDSEVIVQHLGHMVEGQHLSLWEAVRQLLPRLDGAYALAMLDVAEPDTIIGARHGSPLVVGLGLSGEHYLASDAATLLPFTRNYIVLEDGDIAKITTQNVIISDASGVVVFDSARNNDDAANTRTVRTNQSAEGSADRGNYRHFMYKEIVEQPQSITETLEGRLINDTVSVPAFGVKAEDMLATIKRVHIISCGTSAYAGMVFAYWCEDILGIPARLDVASEFRYRNPAMEDNTLVIAISQSGETADTKVAVDIAIQKRTEGALNMPILTICNVPESTLTRMADLVFLTHAGPEIGVASTKAFTTQLVSLALLLVSIGKVHQRLSAEREQRIVEGLRKLPAIISEVLAKEPEIIAFAQKIEASHNAIFLGRSALFPIALEGALKLKEISYIHAEALPAGELKHGPLALVDDKTPVIVVAPKDDLLDKLKSNLAEVAARGGQLFVFEDAQSKVTPSDGLNVITIADSIGRISAPILFTIPLQLLAYHVALMRGTDIDQPRNLAKSVTVE